MGKLPKRAIAAARKAAGGPVPDAAKVNLSDGASLKRALDEAAAEALTSSGYAEDHFVSNVKISVSLFLCALAAIAQFWPQKFPGNWNVLAFCVAAYGLGTVALNMFTSRFEGDAFLFLRADNKQDEAQLRVTSKLPRFSYEYELIIAAEQRESVTMSQDIKSVFTSDGHLADSRFKAEVKTLLQNFESSSTQKKSQ